MKIPLLDNGYIELLDVMPKENLDLAVVNAARVSYLGESKGEEADWKLLRYLYEHKHTTPFEQVQFKWRVKCPIFVARQWMRHRTWSYNEQSRRYSDDTPEFYIPRAWRVQSQSNKQGSGDIHAYSGDFWSSLTVYCDDGLERYEEAIAAGVAREMARMFLPVNMYTTFVGSVNAHNLMRFLRLRMDEHAQYEIRVYANAMFDIFSELMPETAKLFEEKR
jgi:thymidylate synthase (FAD)